MSRRKNGSIAGTIITIIILVAIVAGVVLLVQRHKEDIEEAFNDNFGVVYNEKTYRGKLNGVNLPETGQAVFSIKNVATCTVKVVPNYDFTYAVDGVEHHFTEHENLTGVFVEQSNIFADYFVINCAKDSYSIEVVLKSLHGSDAEIVLPKLTKVYPYRLVVTSNTGDEIWLHFGQGEGWSHAGIDPDGIVF